MFREFIISVAKEEGGHGRIEQALELYEASGGEVVATAKSFIQLREFLDRPVPHSMIIFDTNGFGAAEKRQVIAHTMLEEEKLLSFNSKNVKKNQDLADMIRRFQNGFRD